MRLKLIPVMTLLALGGCATPSAKAPVIPDGKHRRPANPYGITLPMPQGAPLAVTPAPGGVNVFKTQKADPAAPAEQVVPAIKTDNGEPN